MILNRFHDMRQLAASLQKELHHLEEYGYGDSVNDWVTAMLRERCAGTPVRAYYMAKTAEWLLPFAAPWRRLCIQTAAGKKLLQVQLPLIFEGVITIQYLHNQILDRKSGVTSPARINHNLLAANLLKEQLYRYIDGECPGWAKKKVEKQVRRIFELVDLGQQIEQQWNTVSAFYRTDIRPAEAIPLAIRESIDWSGADEFMQKLRHDLPRNAQEHLDIYFHRIYLTCAALFVEGTNLLIQLLGLPARKTMAIRQFSLCYGLMRQLVNDNADWLPSKLALKTKAKAADDAFSDLRKGTLTLPLLFLLAEQEKGITHHLAVGTMNWSTAFEEPVFEEMLQSTALYKSIQNARILGELAIAHLPLDQRAPAHLADSCEIVHWNKFLAPCLRHPAYATYRKSSYCRRTRRLIKALRQQRLVTEASSKQSFVGWKPWPEPVFPEAARRAKHLVLQASNQ